MKRFKNIEIKKDLVITDKEKEILLNSLAILSDVATEIENYELKSNYKNINAEDILKANEILKQLSEYKNYIQYNENDTEIIKEEIKEETKEKAIKQNRKEEYPLYAVLEDGERYALTQNTFDDYFQNYDIKHIEINPNQVKLAIKILDTEVYTFGIEEGGEYIWNDYDDKWIKQKPSMFYMQGMIYMPLLYYNINKINETDFLKITSDYMRNIKIIEQGGFTTEGLEGIGVYRWDNSSERWVFKKGIED